MTRTILLTIAALMVGPAAAQTYGTPETCRGDFSGDVDTPIIVIGDRLHEQNAICTFGGRCADADGKTWIDLVVVSIEGDLATVTYEDGEIILKRCG